jgi:exodeoxyribonuclease VII large subunit
MSSSDRDILTVSEVNALVSSLIEESFPEVAVIGEISNFKRHSSGHLYMTLKDASSQLRVVCFRSDAVRVDFDPEDGLRVIAKGKLTLYEPYGQYQLVAHSLKLAGAGELEKAFRELCSKLEKEGLFAAEHKKKLPPFPFRIAVITSPTGAAVRDIVSTLGRRWPCVEVLLLPVHVQGEQAAPEIVRALQLAPGLGEIDLIILGRGGGSLEDLWAFNEEVVGRAVFSCPIPVISAVGHESDFTITDFVADVRAATPTMAGEIAVPMKSEVSAGIDANLRRLAAVMARQTELYSSRLQELLRSYGLGKVKGHIEKSMQKLDFAMEKLFNRMKESIKENRSTLNERVTALQSLSPRAVLERGYAMCSNIATGEILSSVDAAVRADRMRITFQDGRILVQVKEKEDEKD